MAAGVIGRAVSDEKISVSLFNPRDFTSDVHRTVDDRPFGGGPGMVMKAEPLIAAILAAKTAIPNAQTVYMSPQGVPLKQPMVREWGTKQGVILIAGRYEGIDERVISQYVDAEISIGDFVLSGGEIAAMVMIDALSRLIPGVLGSHLSAAEDSFGEDGLLDHPHYTRPDVLADNVVPAVLKSGDHKAIAAWRRKMAVTRTWERRPDLLANANLTAADELVLTQLNDALGGDKPDQH